MDAPTDVQPDVEHSFVDTEPNSYTIFRRYHRSYPTLYPTEDASLSQVSDAPNFAISKNESNKRPWWGAFGASEQSVKDDLFKPFLNISTFYLMDWFYSGSNLKSLTELDRLVTDVILAPDFKAEDLKEFRGSREAKHLDDYRVGMSASAPSSTRFSPDDGWIEGCVKIPLPCENVAQTSEAEAPQFNVEGVFYRRPLSVIQAALSDVSADNNHFIPFKNYWTPSEDHPPERIYSELYTADAFIQEHETVRAQYQTLSTGPQLETVIAAIMLWSDSTHLTSFGNASLWPIYMFLGNQSKYIRSKTTSFAAHHLAYIPKVGFSLRSINLFDIKIFSYPTHSRTFTSQSLGTQQLQPL